MNRIEQVLWRRGESMEIDRVWLSVNVGPVAAVLRERVAAYLRSVGGVWRVGAYGSAADDVFDDLFLCAVDHRYVIGLCSQLLRKREFGQCLLVSLCAWIVPIQCERGFDLIECYLLSLERAAGRAVPRTKDDRVQYPLKANMAAKTKVNMFFRDVLASAERFYGKEVKHFVGNESYCIGMANDEATGWLLWFVVYARVSLSCALTVLSRARDSGFLKGLSNMVKAIGIGNDKRLAMLAELRGLRGRGIEAPAFEDDVRARVDVGAFKAEKDAGLDVEEVRRYVKIILRRELMRPPEYKSRDDVWSRRWSSTPAGANAHELERRVFGRTMTGSQATKREFAENVKTNMIGFGKAEVYIGPSVKLEHDKGRWIYATDTRSFYSFDYLLKPIEDVWAGRRVILSPGLERDDIRYAALSKCGVKMMADFDDFNSAHSIAMMQMVVEEVGAYCPDKAVVKWCTDSLSGMLVRTEPGRFEKWVATLPSGHRGTTFFNTVLNGAYIMCVLGDDYEGKVWQHAGDDVFAGCEDIDAMAVVVKKLRASTLRMNPSKQGFGTVSGEFLRVSFNGSGAVGYFARAVASGVSGSWVSDAPVGSREYMEGTLERAWTWAVRSGQRCGVLMYHTCLRRQPELAAYWVDILCCRTSVNGSPVLENGDTWREVSCEFAAPIYEVSATLKGRATDDYIREHVNWNMLTGLDIKPERLRKMMLEVSERRVVRVPGVIKYITADNVRTERVVASNRVEVDADAKGVLSRVFPLTFMKSELGMNLTRNIMAEAGYYIGTSNAYSLAWGYRRRPAACVGELPYTLVSSVSKSVGCTSAVVAAYQVAK